MNAKQEFLQTTNNVILLCADVNYIHIFEEDKSYILKIGYTPLDYNKFIDSLDFEYETPYGGQEIFGIIWLSDGAWYDRSIWDNDEEVYSEYWEYHKCPDIPEKCK